MRVPETENLLQLHDIHLPDAPGWWPPAAGWWLMALILLLAGYWSIRRFGSWYRARRWRKKLLSEFDRYDKKIEQLDDAQLTTEISSHLRRLALTLYPARNVAGLTGSNWLDFLEQHSRHKGFMTIPGNYLAETPYKKPQHKLSIEQKRQLLTLARQWAIYNTALFSAAPGNAQENR